MKFKIEDVIRDYLPGVIHMSLATCVDNKPWVSEVHYAYDEELTIYWRSKADRRHSIEIAKNPFVAGTIVEQHGLTDKPRGLYFEGKANVLTNVTEQDPAYIEYCRRFGNGLEILDDAASEGGHQFYKLTVSDYYVFDSRESTPSQKYHLSWKV